MKVFSAIQFNLWILVATLRSTFLEIHVGIHLTLLSGRPSKYPEKLERKEKRFDGVRFDRREGDKRPIGFWPRVIGKISRVAFVVAVIAAKNKRISFNFWLTQLRNSPYVRTRSRVYARGCDPAVTNYRIAAFIVPLSAAVSPIVAPQVDRLSGDSCAATS